MALSPSALAAMDGTDVKAAAADTVELDDKIKAVKKAGKAFVPTSFMLMRDTTICFISSGPKLIRRGTVIDDPFILKELRDAGAELHPMPA